ncbi:MAG: DNA-deoxyinosine glycosylase [Anaerovoracaceae bacterium]|jgi:TDG/mug DNA glycosylase family protein
MRVQHDFAPIFDAHSRILILGTMPSVKSREGHFYYHHPRNRFWKVMASVLSAPLPQTIAEKKEMLLQGHAAVWDVIDSCEIRGSSDASIRDVVPADINRVLRAAPIEAICANGAAAARLYRRCCEPETGRAIVQLPSTSPANAAWSLPRLTAAWREAIAASGALRR